jgi:hypothetical protein
MMNTEALHPLPLTEEDVRNELARIEKAIVDSSTPRDLWCQLYAARQAMLWMLNEFVAPPYKCIMEDRVKHPSEFTDIQEG